MFVMGGSRYKPVGILRRQYRITLAASYLGENILLLLLLLLSFVAMRLFPIQQYISLRLATITMQ